MNGKEQRAVVLLSGGLDSSTCMAVAQDKGYELFTLTFSYGQRHHRELSSARKVSESFGSIEHRVIDLAFLAQIGGSALTDQQIEVRTDGLQDDIPATYVPARNMIFLSLAAAYAEVIAAKAIYIGVSAVDYSGYPDCRPEFIQSMQNTINLGTKCGTSDQKINIETPLLGFSKKDTIQLGMELGVPYHLTTSCYQGQEEACGICDSCLLRIKGFREVGARDPIPYKSEIDWGENVGQEGS